MVDSTNLVPGVMRCAKCNFQLVRITLAVNVGKAIAGDSHTEPCPNGCGPLWPVTWEQYAGQMQEAAELMAERAIAAEKKLEALKVPASDDDLARRLMKAVRHDALTWADRNAIGEAIGRIGAVFTAPRGAEHAGFLQEDDYHLLHRFIETTDDDESYDIGNDAVKRLADLGVVQSHGFGRYSVTMFGHWVHERYWHQNPSLPLMTNSDRDRAARSQAKEPRP